MYDITKEKSHNVKHYLATTMKEYPLRRESITNSTALFNTYCCVSVTAYQVDSIQGGAYLTRVNTKEECY